MNYMSASQTEKQSSFMKNTRKVVFFLAMNRWSGRFWRGFHGLNTRHRDKGRPARRYERLSDTRYDCRSIIGRRIFYDPTTSGL